MGSSACIWSASISSSALLNDPKYSKHVTAIPMLITIQNGWYSGPLEVVRKKIDAPPQLLSVIRCSETESALLVK